MNNAGFYGERDATIREVALIIVGAFLLLAVLSINLGG